MSITLESIKAEQSRLSKLITAFEAQAEAGRRVLLPEALIKLKPGESYAGTILGLNGETSYHLIALADVALAVSWEEAVAWAKGQGGELPTRQDLLLLSTNLRHEFEEAWYWSGEPSKDGCGVWFQNFSDGCKQGYDAKHYKLRARAVRRIPCCIKTF